MKTEQEKQAEIEHFLEEVVDEGFKFHEVVFRAKETLEESTCIAFYALTVPEFCARFLLAVGRCRERDRESVSLMDPEYPAEEHY